MNNMKPQRGKTPRKGPAPKRPSKQTDPVEVYSRVRPLDNPDADKCVKVVSPTTLQLTPPEGSHAMRHGTAHSKQTQYTFSYVFDEFSDQKSVFKHCAQPLAEDVIRGKNALLFAYGITSSGKTFTMTGSPQEQGVLPRCLDVIFNSIGHLQAKKYVFRPDKMNGFEIQTEADAMMERQRRDVMPRFGNKNTHGRQTDTSDSEDPFSDSPRVRDASAVQDVEEDNNYAVFVSYVQIYNNYIYDLLEELQYDPILGYKQPQSKILREDSVHNMYVSGVHEVEVKSTEEAYKVFLKGQKRRKVAQTALNAESSRSHSVFNIRLVQAPLDPIGQEVLQDRDKILVSQLSLVDLAGSERSNRTGGTGDRLREAGNINQSLMVLRTCMEALRENQKSNSNNKMVPYRDSRLTHLFKNYFDGEGKVRMVVCVNPLAEEYDETVHVMKFAEMTQEVQVARPTQVKFDIGLAPGRRRMAIKYREAVNSATDSEVDVPEPMVYSLGPPFPALQMKDPQDNLLFSTLADFLADRARRRVTLNDDFDMREERFRKNLLSLEQENRELKQRVGELESKLNSHSDDTTRLQRRVRSLEKSNENLSRAASCFELDKKELERELDAKAWQVEQLSHEQHQMKDDYRTRLVLTEQTYRNKMDTQKRKIEEQSQAQLRSKQKKLEMVKNILDSDSESVRSADPMAPPPAATRSGVRTRYGANVTSSGYGMARSYPAKSEPDLSGKSKINPGGATPRVAPSAAHFRARTAYTPAASGNTTRQTPGYMAHTTSSSNKPMSTPARRGRSPPPTKPKPVLAKYHRRSRSQGDIWLDHKPSPVVNTDTLLQPRMQKKRSVKSLEKKDLRSTNKYVLTQQQQDSDGGISSQLVKGEVLRTSAGGTSVVFTELETLKQKSPGDRKRRSPPLRPEDFDGEWTDSEERCRIAIEGHGNVKKIKSSAV